MSDEPEAIAAGQEVTVRGERWTVLRSTAYDDCTALWLNGIGRANASARRTVLLPFDTVEPHRPERRVQTARARRWCRGVRRQVRQQQPFGGLDALVAADIQLHPYQLEPALALHRHGHLRILLADAVGLGKTIQAGAALAQLTHDDPGVRTLIVCPAGLRTQWRQELAGRFGLDAVICDPEWLAAAGRDLPPGVNPWSLPGIYLASVDLIKRPEILRDLDDLTWDLSVFDEAHGLSPGTARLAAARVVADRSRRILVLTATPPDGDPDHLGALMSLGQAPDGAPVVIFRRTRGEAGLGAERRTVVLAVRPSPAEAMMHQRLEAYTSALWREAAGRGDAAGRLLSILLRKRALSSAGSLAASVARRLTLLASLASPPTPMQALLPLYEDDVQDDVPDPIVGARGLVDVVSERSALAAIHAAAVSAAAAESKVRALLRFLRRVRQPAIVFTEYRDTLARLAAAMDTAPLQLHGGMLAQERAETQLRFSRDGGVLLATDAASEGLNLHQRCRLVVHFELPWNPMRLEQRIGRVDRLGQQRLVHEVLLVARHTAERLVLVPLVRRVRAAQTVRAAGSLARLSESDVAAAILGDTPVEPGSYQPATTSSIPLTGESQREARRLAAMRTGRPRRAAAAEPILYWQRDESRVLTVITRASGETGGGRQLGSSLVPLRIDLAGADRQLSVEEVSALVTPVVEDHLSGRSPWDGWPRVLAALLRREREIGALVTSTVQHPVQAGLFDRRTEADQEARRQTMTAWRAQADARLASLEREGGVHVRVDVVAICAGAPGHR